MPDWSLGVDGCFCPVSRHRHPTSHDCARDLVVEAETAKTNKNELARSLLAKHFPTPTPGASSPSSAVQTAPGKSPSSDPKKLAMVQKVQAMKMRQRAIPGDPKDRTTAVPLDQKVHVRVKLEGKPEGSNVGSVLWFRKVNASPHPARACSY